MFECIDAKQVSSHVSASFWQKIVMKETIFAITLLSVSIILALGFLQLAKEEFQFWPPESRDTIQYKIFWALFRIFFFGLCLISILEVLSGKLVQSDALRYSGLLLLVSGIGSATVISFLQLGSKNAHGEKDKLITGGAYRFSRNPIYLTSIIGMVGWGVIFDSNALRINLFCWAVSYLIAPFLEEPWMERCYGKDYITYKSTTARFLGWK